MRKTKFLNIAKRGAYALMAMLVFVYGTIVPAHAEYDPWAVIAEVVEFPGWDYIDNFFNTDFVVSGNVNLRTGPSTNDPIIEVLDAGTVIELWDFDPWNWSQVRANGQMGYVNSQFVVAEWEFEEMRLVAAGQFVYPTAPSHIGTVELLPWSYVRNFWARGQVAQITDVRTGLVYSVRNMGNGNHSDVETVTQADTDIMRRTYGGVWSWATRPIIVSVNGRHIAASINGMPHAGSTIVGNGMQGHVCIHFHGSRTHNGNQRHTQDHQNAVQEAFNVIRSQALQN
ncbi:MAG: SH3 domain-containing protein [Defluviitaleaceae bacterium]|nr:SH3 domain-containing protein [Defluviitaleaceae bacterium]